MADYHGTHSLVLSEDQFTALANATSRRREQLIDQLYDEYEGDDEVWEDIGNLDADLPPPRLTVVDCPSLYRRLQRLIAEPLTGNSNEDLRRQGYHYQLAEYDRELARAGITIEEAERRHEVENLVLDYRRTVVRRGHLLRRQAAEGERFPVTRRRELRDNGIHLDYARRRLRELGISDPEAAIAEREQ
jgi:hypothetical protein